MNDSEQNSNSVTKRISKYSFFQQEILEFTFSYDLNLLLVGPWQQFSLSSRNLLWSEGQILVFVRLIYESLFSRECLYIVETFALLEPENDLELLYANTTLNCWSLVLAEVLYAFFFCLSACLSMILQHIISDICLKLDSHKIRRAAKSKCWHQISSSYESPKGPKSGLKMRLFGFWPKYHTMDLYIPW